MQAGWHELMFGICLLVAGSSLIFLFSKPAFEEDDSQRYGWISAGTMGRRLMVFMLAGLLLVLGIVVITGVAIRFL